MRRLLSVILIILTVSVLYSETVFSSLSENSRKEMAVAYYLVGTQYTVIGRKTKGDEYIAMAYQINPGFDPATAGSQPVETTVTETVEVNIAPDTEPDMTEEMAVTMAKQQVKKMIRSFFREDLAAFENTFNDNIYTNSGTFSSKEAADYLKELFGKQELGTVSPKKYLNPVDMEISNISSSSEPVIRVIIEVYEKGKEIFPEFLFDDSMVNESGNYNVSLYFIYKNGNWLLAGVNKAL